MTIIETIDYDHIPTDDEPTSVEVAYPDVDLDTLVALAIAGDQEAINFLNSTANDAPLES